MTAPINGLLLIDKTSGCTSHDVVDDLRHILKQSAVGHTGTLDPLASGLMVMLLGQATKLSEYILAQDKRYRVELQLGITTDSGDTMGTVVRELVVDHSQARIHQVLSQLQGEMMLPVPIFSATKVQGKRLYEYARAEVEVTAPIKPMRFYDLEIIDIQPDRATLEISCSKGGYIRSWVVEAGRLLGCGAIMSGLRRLESAPYHIHNAITVSGLRQALQNGINPVALGPAYIPMSATLPTWPTCLVKGREEQLLKNGQISHDLVNRLVVAQKQAHRLQTTVGIKVLNVSGELLGLIEAKPLSGLKIRRIFAS